MIARLMSALLVSAIILMAVYGFSFYSESNAKEALSVDIDLSLIIGRAIQKDDIRVISPGQDGRAILAGVTQSIRTDDYRFLQLDMIHAEKVEDILFFWRLENDPASVKTALLPLNANGGLFNLGDEKYWNGTITELGLMVYGGQDTQINVASMKLMPPTFWRLIHAEFNQWIAVWRWDQKTAHFLRWDGINLNPVPAVAVWLLVAFVLYSFWGKEKKKAAIMLLITGWVILDLRWYWEQYHQVNDLKNQLVEFPKETVISLDAELYGEIERLKSTVLPQEPVRVQIVKSGPANDYMRWKAQYYLLPHPVYNYGSQPIWEKLQPGDWLWAMGETPDFSYDDMIGLYNKGNRLSAIKMDKGSIGTLYKIL
jgi:hypothetical protein